MREHGVEADAEVFGNLPVRAAAHNLLQHVNLAGRQFLAALGREQSRVLGGQSRLERLDERLPRSPGREEERSGSRRHSLADDDERPVAAQEEKLERYKV